MACFDFRCVSRLWSAERLRQSRGVICHLPLAVLSQSLFSPPPPSLLVTCHSPWSPPAFTPWYCHANSKQCICIMCNLTEPDVARRRESRRQNFWRRFQLTRRAAAACLRCGGDLLERRVCVCVLGRCWESLRDPGGSCCLRPLNGPLVAPHSAIRGGYLSPRDNAIKSGAESLRFLIKSWGKRSTKQYLHPSDIWAARKAKSDRFPIFIEHHPNNFFWKMPLAFFNQSSFVL